MPTYAQVVSPPAIEQKATTPSLTGFFDQERERAKSYEHAQQAFGVSIPLGGKDAAGLFYPLPPAINRPVDPSRFQRFYNGGGIFQNAERPDAGRLSYPEPAQTTPTFMNNDRVEFTSEALKQLVDDAYHGVETKKRQKEAETESGRLHETTELARRPGTLMQRPHTVVMQEPAPISGAWKPVRSVAATTVQVFDLREFMPLRFWPTPVQASEAKPRFCPCCQRPF